MSISGNQGFRYDPGGGTVELFLNYPLYWRRPGRTKWRRESWNLERDKREVLTIGGSAVEEMYALIRFSNQPLDLLDMLEAGADGVDLDYYPDMGLGTNYPSQLIEPVGETLELIRDRSSRGALGEFESELRLRRTDGGNYDALFT